MVSRWWLWLSLCAEAASALILLAPPADHYAYYASMRDELFSFTQMFSAVTNATGERLYAVADDRGRRRASGRAASPRRSAARWTTSGCARSSVVNFALRAPPTERRGCGLLLRA